jgi:hypothetical protein
LSEAATLSCFGAYYQEDVLGDLDGTQEHSQLHENRLGRCILWRSFRIEENYLIIMINDI